MCGVPKLTYHLRNLPPAVTTPVARWFDDQVLQTFASILDVPLAHLSDSAIHQLQLPIRRGGLGLRPQVTVAPAAWTASTACCTPDLLATQTGWLPPPGSPLFTSWADSLTALRAAADPATLGTVLPPTAHSFVAFYAPKFSNPAAVPPRFRHLQARLTGAVEATRHLRLLSTSLACARARLLSCSGPSNSGCLVAPPRSAALSVSDFAFRTVCKLRLGLPVTPDSECFHPACPPSALRLDPAHFLYCPGLSHLRTQRHDRTVLAVLRLARVLGLQTTHERRFNNVGVSTDPDSRRPDGRVLGVNGSLYFDATLPTPSAPSHRDRSARTARGTATAAEDSKTDKFRTWARVRGSSFFPFAIETFGAWGRGACRLGRRLRSMSDATLAVSASLGPPTADVQRAFQAVSVCVQKGNAALVAAGLSRQLAH